VVRQSTRASSPFSLNLTGTLSRRYLAQFVSAVDNCQQQRAAMRLRTVFMITGIGVHDPPESVFTIDWN
jgi:hypothetical protein